MMIFHSAGVKRLVVHTLCVLETTLSLEGKFYL